MGTYLQPERIAYLAQTFPGLTTVYREVIALRKKGADVHSFATWKTPTANTSVEARDLAAQTFYIFPINWLSFLKAHLGYLLFRPFAYLGALIFVSTRPDQSLIKWWRTFLHFLEAVYLAQEIEKKGIRHIHVHFAGNAATLALVVQRLTGIPYSFTAHAYDIFLDQVILKEKIEGAQFIVAISEYNKRFLVDFAGDPTVADKIQVIHSGIPIDDFSPAGKEPSTVKNPPLILSVGRLVEKKGFPVLIRACGQLRDRGYRLRCVIIGTGPDQEALQSLIGELDLEGIVALPGWLDQSQVRAYLVESTLFALPCVIASDKDRDGIPAVLMEAMAMEKPCVSTLVSGIPELIEDGRSGLLVPEQDSLALAAALARLLDDPEFAARLGRAGREKVNREFNVDKITDQLLYLFTNGADPKISLPAGSTLASVRE